MSESNRQNLDLEGLLLRVLSNEATPSEVALLNRSLQESPEIREEACQFLCDDSLLSEVSTTEREAADFVKSMLGQVELSGRATDAQADKSFLMTIFERVNQQGAAIAAVSAALLLGLYLHTSTLNTKIARLHRLSIAGVEQQDGSAGAGAAVDQEDDAADLIGRVSGLMEPVWGEGATPLSFGDRVRKEQTIDLESGVVELLLSTGSKVTIEGPAKLKAQSAMETILLHGRLAAAAPRLARGYTVVTPTAELVDIGTQFGVVVEESGDSELHVFDGDVVARSRLASDGADLIHAKQNEAMRFSSVSAEPERFEAREHDFIRHAFSRYSPSELPPLPTTDSLSLWYSADKCKGVGKGNRVGKWCDLLIGDNDFADNAWQFDETRRPQLIEDGCGRRALRFDGWSSFLSTSPMDPTEQQTIFLVYMPAPITYDHSQFLVWYGGEPSLELTLLPDSSVRGWVWPGPGQTCVGNLVSEPIDNEQPAVLAYQYDAVNNTARLWINGELRGTASAPIAVMNSGERYIGRHANPDSKSAYFGNLYEVVMFDSVIQDDQLQGFWDYFSKRYHL